jgi:PTS system nitrogen regulatory IIA component
MTLTLYLGLNDILEETQASNKKGFLREVSAFIASRHGGTNAKDIERILVEREKLGSTGLEEEAAIPHGKVNGLKECIVCFARSSKGIDFEGENQKPKKLFFVVLVSGNDQMKHLKILARVAKLLKQKSLRRGLLEAKSVEEIYRIIEERDALLGEDGLSS